MPLKKHQALRKFLHFADNNHTTDDRYYEVRRGLDIIKENCNVVQNERRQAIDEMMGPFKGARAGNRKQTGHRGYSDALLENLQFKPQVFLDQDMMMLAISQNVVFIFARGKCRELSPTAGGFSRCVPIAFLSPRRSRAESSLQHAGGRFKATPPPAVIECRGLRVCHLGRGLTCPQMNPRIIQFSTHNYGQEHFANSFHDKIDVKHVNTEVDYTIGLQFISRAPCISWVELAVNRVRFPDFRIWESCRTMSLRSGSAPSSPRFTLIGSQDLAVKSHPNLSTLDLHRAENHTSIRRAGTPAQAQRLGHSLAER
ncbi:hypothetical protein PR048_010527 [Dryococelus australis]|uniref:Uncharacterized protein n=1 Tax=Dryococelus australis TaxID=614101 RepID=A0ABQ9I308_9NEOP|nr:hypothetical protein PR048_010527 [Dryococelus australis]